MVENPYQSTSNRISRIDTRTPNRDNYLRKIRALIGIPILRGRELQESEYPPAIVSWMKAMKSEYYSATQTSQFSPDVVMEIGYELGDTDEQKGKWYRVEYSMAYGNEVCRGSRPEAMEFLVDASGDIIRTIQYTHRSERRSSKEFVSQEEYMEPTTLSEDQKKMIIDRIASSAEKEDTPINLDIDAIEAIHVITQRNEGVSPEHRIQNSIRFRGTLKEPVQMKYPGYSFTYRTKEFEGRMYPANNSVQLKFYMLKEENK